MNNFTIYLMLGQKYKEDPCYYKNIEDQIK